MLHHLKILSSIVKITCSIINLVRRNAYVNWLIYTEIDKSSLFSTFKCIEHRLCITLVCLSAPSFKKVFGRSLSRSFWELRLMYWYVNKLYNCFVKIGHQPLDIFIPYNVPVYLLCLISFIDNTCTCVHWIICEYISVCRNQGVYHQRNRSQITSYRM